MPTFVQVVVNIPQVTGVFDYHVPEALAGSLLPGCLVVVPFGGQTVQGVVLCCVGQPQVTDTRPVQELLDPLPVVTPAQIELARWLSEQSLAPLAACLEVMLPPGLSQHSEMLVHLARPDAVQWVEAEQPGGNALAIKVLNLLHKRGDLRAGQMDAALPHQAWRPSVTRLARRGLVQTSNSLLPPAVRPKVIRTVQLALPPEQIEAQMTGVGRPGSDVSSRRQAILRFLMREPVPVEIPWVMANSGGRPEDLTRLAEMGLVILGETEIWRDPLRKLEYQPYAAPPLTPQQQQVWDEIRAVIHPVGDSSKSRIPLLLHGVTGSGKTELYLQAVAETLRMGRQAIVLVPEIALTPQTLRRFMGRFPGQVGVIHSRLSPGERYDTWRRARSGLLPVIVGPRSALFAPLPDLGLIVVDECHDESYYQNEYLPYYHAVNTAVAYARLAGAVILLGSATPDITQTYQAELGRWRRLRLPERLLAHREVIEKQASQLGVSLPALEAQGQAATLALPAVTVVDMRRELTSGNRSIFSLALQSELKRVLDSNQQAILFLNRRGTATYVFCRACGHILDCPRCDRPLTYHEAQGGLTCHACGYQRQMPARCPACGSPTIRQFGTGTEKVESEVQALFPQAHTLRWDAETTRQKGAHEIILSHFAAHHADILVGTQMLAKGLDLPLVTLVGVVLAEVGLNLPDYRASERVFQVLTQVAGRAGRSFLGGKVILQTFQPEAYPIQAAAGHDYASFYARELAYRRELGYPPFFRLVRLEYRHAQEAQAREAALRLAAQLHEVLQKEDRKLTELIGPAPCFFSRQEGYYRWQIVIRGPDPVSLLRRSMPEGWRVEVDPPSLL